VFFGAKQVAYLERHLCSAPLLSHEESGRLYFILTLVS